MFSRTLSHWREPGGILSRSISRKVLASFVAIYAVTYVATAVIVYSSVYASVLDSNTGALHELARRKYERLEAAFVSLATNLTAWSQLEVMNDLVSGDIDRRVKLTLDGVKNLYALSGDIYAYNSSGKLISTTRERGSPRDLPAVWKRPERHLVFLDKHVDPVAGGDIVALEIPIFGSFDRDYLVGWLVLTYPWPEVERFLFGDGVATVLNATDRSGHALAADWGPLSDRADDDTAASWLDGSNDDVIVGRSLPGNTILGHWRVSVLRDTNVVVRLLWRIGAELALLGIALAVPIIALGRWLSNRLTSPVVDLTRVVSEIANTDKLDVRVPVSTDDEFGTLARSFNRMTESLERATRERERFVGELEVLNRTLESKVAERTQELEVAIRSQQRLIGDISHEIKSPLARLGMALALLRRSVADRMTTRHFDRIEREIENISALASELLTFMRLDTQTTIREPAEVDLCELVRRIVADAVYEAPDRFDDMQLSVPGSPAVVTGDALLLARAIENVVRNALFYTSARTPIEIVVRPKGGDRVVVEVHDQGPGVPDAALAQLFEPFYRVDEARTRKTGGSGMGLAICQRVAALHGGSVRARHNSPQGLVVEIDLPAAHLES